MCGACEDEVFLTTPNPHCVLKGLAHTTPAGAASRRRFTATEVVEAAPSSTVFAATPLLSLSIGRTKAARTARA
jgi:hypothetical protein